MYKIITNKIRCKFCGDIIESRSVHDLVRCRCGKCSVDGGHEYAKRSFFTEKPEDTYEDLSTYVTDSGKIVPAKDASKDDIPFYPIRIEIKKVEVPDEPKTPHEVIENIAAKTNEEIAKAADAVINDLDISEVIEAGEAEPLKEEKIVKRDKNGKPIAGRYPFGKKD